MRKRADLIGVPFEWGGRGPNSYDCYGLLMKLYKDERGIDLPDYLSPTDAPRIAALMTGQLHLWRECEPAPGVLVWMRAGYFLHVGYVIENERFMHTWEKSGGVVIERLSDWERRIIGFYDYAG